MSDTTINNPYVDEPRLHREDVLARIERISQLEYENDFYTHHDGSVWDYFGEIILRQSTEESGRFWTWVQSGAGLAGEIAEDGIVFEHSLSATYAIPIVMGEEIDAPDEARPRYDRAFAAVPQFVWVVSERRAWQTKLAKAADDVANGYDSGLARYNEAMPHIPEKRPKPPSPDEYDAAGNLIF